MSSKTIILYYEGNYTKRTINSQYTEYNIPRRHLGEYITGAENSQT